jgi:hypothetical protein
MLCKTTLHQVRRNLFHGGPNYEPRILKSAKRTAGLKYANTSGFPGRIFKTIGLKWENPAETQW